MILDRFGEPVTGKIEKEDGIAIFYGGIGSEEIFAGYQRHELANDANEECWRGLMNMQGRDFVRDAKVAQDMKITFLTPFMDSDLIAKAMSIPGKYKIAGEKKKMILRETALKMGLAESIAFRKKIAAQYGSGFDKAIEKLARKAGYKFKKDYLASLIHY